jgi:hypothetical protein
MKGGCYEFVDYSTRSLVYLFELAADPDGAERRG